MRPSFFVAALLGLGATARAQNAPPVATPAALAAQGLFPFALPPLDDAPNSFDLSSLNEKPAGARGFVRASGENFVDGAGKKIRFWGVNLNFEGAFPDKQLAPKIAGRLAKFGFNSVRFHHFDANAEPRGFWKAASPTTARLKIPREVDLVQLDKLDFFAAELMKRGIYLDFNLHVARKLVDGEGFANAALLPDKDKGMAAIDAGIAAQNMAFAKLLLTHVNPYTGRAYKDEPGVCALEVDNESSVLALWLDGSLGKLPNPYAENLRGSWNTWLGKKYGSEAALRRAWTEIDAPLSGPDLLRAPALHPLPTPFPAPRPDPTAPLILGQNGDVSAAPNFANPNGAPLGISPETNSSVLPESTVLVPGVASETLAGLDKWKLNLAGGAAGTVARDDLGGPSISGFVQPGISLNLSRAGSVSWAFQLVRDDLTLEDGKPYTFSFWARSDSRRSIGINLWQDEKPFKWLGYTGQATLSNDWQKYTFTMRASGAEAGQVRLALNLGAGAGGVQFGVFNLQSGGKVSAPETYNLREGVPLPTAKNEAIFAVRRDFAQFLGEIEAKNVAAMRRFLILDLGVRVPIWHTQAQFGGWGGVRRETLSDAVDVHVYWKHPDFGGTGWNGGNWRVENQSMAATPLGDPLASYGMLRVPGKPMVISEFNSGQPNDFGAESLPMLAAFAAYQGYAGAWIFDYHSAGPFERDKFEGFFSIDTQPVKMATAPMAALIFRRPISTIVSATTDGEELGDVSLAKNEISLNLPDEIVWGEVGSALGAPAMAPYLKTWNGALAPRGVGLNGRVSNTRNPGLFISPSVASAATPNQFRSDTGEIIWDSARGTWNLNTPRSKVVAGFVGGRKIDLDEAQFWVAPSSKWATIGLVSLDQNPIPRARRLLLTLAGRAENPGMGWNFDRTSVGADWGTGPTYVAGISSTIKILTNAKIARVWALDERGNRRGQLTSQLQNGALKFSVSPVWRTLWYEIETS
ncbi:Carbohydrate binding domain-containing protein [Abditibacterium utsteinense]|uniref:Carbohydrate binding domain-containing protein n=1 Tax=Abditibacterium utsteinense TaxID=1960156 RepID=A0A2S8SXF0_9BACT|nr:carbohydrate binding domain-containing protein [Abditibacterium utsteinense]PQV65482.1 Carbohydrate binding domain-containing protein [Abditibacterium utsteinense]